MNCRRLQIAKETLRKSNKAGDIKLFYFKLYYEAIVNKTAWYQHKNDQLVCDRRVKNIQWGKDSFFSKIGQPHLKG